jgi:hypothetical protein
MKWGKRGAWAIGLALVAALSGGVALAASNKPEIEATRLPLVAGSGGQGKIASCGHGERALGGGLVAGDPQDATLAASGPLSAQGASGPTGDGDTPKRWYGAAAAGNADQVFRLFAICAPDSKATIEATRFVPPYRVPTGEFAKCGQGERAVGGGLVAIGPPNYGPMLSSGPLDASGSIANTRDGDIPKQWHASVYNADDDGRVFKVFAVCVPHSDARIEATRFTVGGDQFGEARARCGRGERALGGGTTPSRLTTDPFDLPLIPSSGPLDSSGVAANTRDGDAAKQWIGVADNEFSDDARDFKVFAVCSRGT